MSYNENNTAAILEANASHAVGQYITQGPSKPYEHMSVLGLEGARSKLNASPSAHNLEVSGWVAVEQAFVVAGDKGLRKNYPLEPLFEAAEDAFTTSLDLYDEIKDPPDHLLRVELAMAALPLYSAWASQQPPKPAVLGTFHEETAEIGSKVISLREVSQWDSDTAKTFNGLVAELVVMLAYNRRQRDGSDKEPSFGVPSTWRQNASRMPGRAGNDRDKTKLRGNWDMSIVGQNTGSLALTDKLQIKNALLVLDKPTYGQQTQEYTEDITLVAVKELLAV